MRDLVNRKSFLIRKGLDNLLYRLFESKWVPLYHSVTFTNINYRKCLDNKKGQDRVSARREQIVRTDLYIKLQCTMYVYAITLYL